jgi:hypothetical protein
VSYGWLTVNQDASVHRNHKMKRPGQARQDERHQGTLGPDYAPRLPHQAKPLKSAFLPMLSALLALSRRKSVLPGRLITIARYARKIGSTGYAS